MVLLFHHSRFLLASSRSACALTAATGHFPSPFVRLQKTWGVVCTARGPAHRSCVGRVSIGMWSWSGLSGRSDGAQDGLPFVTLVGEIFALRTLSGRTHEEHSTPSKKGRNELQQSASIASSAQIGESVSPARKGNGEGGPGHFVLVLSPLVYNVASLHHSHSLQAFLFLLG